MNKAQGNRVVALVGSSLVQLKTCATLIEFGVNIVGICICDQRIFNLPLRYTWRLIKKNGIITAIGQILGRIYYNLLNYKKDSVIFQKLYDEAKIRNTLNNWNGDIFQTNNYSGKDTIKWLESIAPDIIVVHSPYWIGKKVRSMARKGIVIGGHPGITPFFRGSDSAFWAAYQGKFEEVGWSVFWLDEGIDTGDLIYQERLAIEQGDSFMTLQGKGMIHEAEMQAKVILDYDNGIEIPRSKHKNIPENSDYSNPTILDYLHYRKRQSIVR
jgi:folate-dependent phosphoribosylglycinamide formyltransferase PurN